jgi:hypothetical protein
MDETALEDLRRDLRQSVGGTYYDQLLADLQARAQIERKPLGGEEIE